MELQAKGERPSTERVSVRRPSFEAVNQGERGPIEAEVADGEHEWVWEDGSEYKGDWVDGKANGRGTFLWPSGSSSSIHVFPFYKPIIF